jgi:EmrB/QacA subfamily drug resistance transporter
MDDAAQSSAPPQALDQAAVRQIILGILLAMLLAALDQTIVATALPTIGSELNDVEHLQWVVTAYLLAATAVTPLYGKLADIYGRRRMLLIAISTFVTGSFLCALAPTMIVLIVSRFIQGLGGGGLIALAQTIVADVVSPRERMRYQAYFASVFVTSSVVGPVIGGFFAQDLHWSFIFWINLPLGAGALAMTYGVLKRLPRHERPHKLDVTGALLMAFSATTLLLALSWGGSTYPWTSVQVLGLVAATVVGWILFATRLLTAAEPFVPLAVLFNPVVGTGTASNFFVVGTMVGLSIFVPIYFEAIVGLTAGQSGLALIALMGGTVTGAQIAGRIMAWTERYKRGPLVGLVIAVVGMMILAWRAGALPLWQIEVLLAICGIGMGTIYPVTTVSIQNAVEPHQLGTATATFNFFRSLGSAILVAVFGTLFIGGLGIGGQAIGSLERLVAIAAKNGTPIGPVFTLIFGAAAITLFAGLICFALMEERPLKTRAGA